MCHRQNTLWPWGCILFETFHCLPLSSWYKTAHGHWPDVNVCRVSCGGVVNMLLVLSITSYFHCNIWGCMCSNGPFQYRWLKAFIYSSLSLCLLYHILLLIAYIYSRKTGNLFSLLLCSLWWMQIIGYVLSWRSYSFLCTLHHLIIIIVQIYLKTSNL